MGSMHKAISAVLILTIAVAAAPVAKHTPAPHAKRVAAPALATPPPEISHVVSRPFCSALRNAIGPAIGTILQNDNIIKENNKYFDDYVKYNGNGATSDASKQMTVMRMENTVGPLVGNIAIVERLLNNQAVFHVPPRTAEEKKLLDMRESLLEKLAFDKASLDVINGFVQTQQLGDIQHAGEGIVNSINGDVNQSKMMGLSTPVPGTVDPNAAGLPQDPHFIDPTTIPGLSLGYNPISHLNDALKWTQAQAHERENAAAPRVMDAVRICNGPAHRPAAPAPAATATP